MILYPEPLGGRLGRLTLDLLALLWTGFWALAGWEVYRLVVALEVVADAITRTGQTFDGWVQAFRDATPGGIPGISSALHSLAGTLQRSAGAPLIQSGMAAHTRIDELAIALGLVVALVPILSVSATYVFWRARDIRELSSAVAFVRAAELSGRVEEARALLAHRAIATLSFRQLMRASPDPVGDLAAGRHHALAAAMLRRAGIRPLEAAGPAPAPRAARR